MSADLRYLRTNLSKMDFHYASTDLIRDFIQWGLLTRNLVEFIKANRLNR